MHFRLSTLTSDQVIKILKASSKYLSPSSQSIRLNYSVQVHRVLPKVIIDRAESENLLSPIYSNSLPKRTLITANATMVYEHLADMKAWYTSCAYNPVGMIKLMRLPDLPPEPSGLRHCISMRKFHNASE